MDLGIEIPKPLSLSASKAASWYRTMTPLIPKLSIEYYGDSEHEVAYEKFRAFWAVKSMLRWAAAHSLVEQGVSEEFLTKFRLPTAEEYVGMAYVLGKGKNTFAYATDILTTVSERERLIFPGTIGESIGMKCNTADGVYVVTEDGWKKESW